MYLQSVHMNLFQGGTSRTGRGVRYCVLYVMYVKLRINTICDGAYYLRHNTVCGCFVAEPS